MAESYHIHRCTKVTYCFGCYMTLLLVNVLSLQDWISRTTYQSIRDAQTEKGRRKNCTENVLLGQCFCWLILLFSTTIYGTVVTHSRQSAMRLAWAGLLCRSPLFPGILLPKKADCLCSGPSCHRSGIQAREGGALLYLL